MVCVFILKRMVAKIGNKICKNEKTNYIPYRNLSRLMFNVVWKERIKQIFFLDYKRSRFRPGDPNNRI